MDEIYSAAMDLLERRFPGARPWTGAAAARSRSGRIFTSVGFESANASASLCYETGAICEAYKHEDPIERILCVIRDQTGRARVIPPCGICRERLFAWGDSVLVALPNESTHDTWRWAPLHELEPHYWGRYMDSR